LLVKKNCDKGVCAICKGLFIKDGGSVLCIKRLAELHNASVDSIPPESKMSDQNVHNAGFTPSGIRGGSLASSMMSQEARASGGGVHSGGPTATLQEMGMCNVVFVWFSGLTHRAKQFFFLENKIAK
uniref:Uncharacterized protein n=1 Tax=Strix occidentalis caurina TaxID=311401 RepID=A0A8D0FE34_STROC